MHLWFHVQLEQKKILNGIYYKAVTIPGGKPFAIVATIVQLFLKATLTTKIMIQAILLPLARTTTFLEFITWPSEIWQGKKMLRGDISLMFQHSVSGFYILLFFKIRQIGVSKQIMKFISQIMMNPVKYKNDNFFRVYHVAKRDMAR